MKKTHVIFASSALISIVSIIGVLSIPQQYVESELYSSIGISAEFVPLVYDGVNREYPDKMIMIAVDDQLFNELPKIKTLLDHTLNIPVPIGVDALVREGIDIDDDSGKYYIIQTGPQMIKGEAYLTEEEVVVYQSLIEKNWISIPIYNEVPRYYVNYNGEVFIIKFDTLSILNKN